MKYLAISIMAVCFGVFLLAPATVILFDPLTDRNFEYDPPERRVSIPVNSEQLSIDAYISASGGIHNLSVECTDPPVAHVITDGVSICVDGAALNFWNVPDEIVLRMREEYRLTKK